MTLTKGTQVVRGEVKLLSHQKIILETNLAKSIKIFKNMPIH